MPAERRTMTEHLNPEISNIIHIPGLGAGTVQNVPGASVSDGPPADFFLGQDGVWQIRATKDDDEEAVRLCSPLRVVALCRRANGSGWGQVIEIEDEDGRSHTVILDAATLSGSASRVVAVLVSKGLVLARGAKVKEGIVELLNAWRPQLRLDLVDALGWTDGACSAFALADGRVLGNAQVYYPGASPELAASVRPHGSQSAWTRNIAEPCLGNPLAILAISQALSGPLLQFLGMQGGGFHLFGASSCGKSTLLQIAASVWGDATLVRSWRVTSNALEPIAAASSGTSLLLDELAEIDPRKLGEVAYLLANGQGKGRLGQKGELTPVFRWRVALLSSGEISIVAHIKAGGRHVHAGHQVRLVDIPADSRAFGAFDVLHGSTDGRVFSERLNRAALEHNGWAGPVFIEALMRNQSERDAMRRTVERFLAMVMRKHDLPQDAQVERVLKRFALAALAGELASKFGLTGWPKGAATMAMMSLVGEWLASQDCASRSKADMSIALTRDYLRTYSASRLSELGSLAVDRQDGWRDDAWFYLLPETWQRVHGDDAVEAARRHRSADLLKASKGHHQFRMPRKVEGQPRVYAVSARILRGPDEPLTAQ